MDTTQSYENVVGTDIRRACDILVQAERDKLWLRQSRDRWRVVALGLSGGLVVIAARIWGELLWVALFGGV